MMHWRGASVTLIVSLKVMNGSMNPWPTGSTRVISKGHNEWFFPHTICWSTTHSIALYFRKSLHYTLSLICYWNTLVLIHCRVPEGRGLHKTARPSGCDETRSVNPLGEGQLIFWSVFPPIVNFRPAQIKKPPLSIYFLFPPDSGISLDLLVPQKSFMYQNLWNLVMKTTKITPKIPAQKIKWPFLNRLKK